MTQKLKVVVAGRSARALKPLADALSGAEEFACSTHLIGDGHADDLSHLEPRPEVLVVSFDADSLSELAALAPEVYCKSEEYRTAQHPDEAQALAACGAETVWLPVHPGLSTTALAARVAQAPASSVAGAAPAAAPISPEAP